MTITGYRRVANVGLLELLVDDGELRVVRHDVEEICGRDVSP